MASAPDDGPDDDDTPPSDLTTPKGGLFGGAFDSSGIADPNVRALLQVRVNHADEAEEVFSTLMGDVVEPRREFIQENALKVANLDV